MCFYFYRNLSLRESNDEISGIIWYIGKFIFFFVMLGGLPRALEITLLQASTYSRSCRGCGSLLLGAFLPEGAGCSLFFYEWSWKDPPTPNCHDL